MQPMQEYQLDYYGDDKPEWLSEEMVRLLLENNYGTVAMVGQLLEILRSGCRVHVRAGIISQVAQGPARQEGVRIVLAAV